LLAEAIHRLAVTIVAGLSAVGFQPTSAEYLDGILKAAWLLFITGFSLLELAVLPLYVFLVFPAFLLVWPLYKYLSRGGAVQEAPDAALTGRGSRPASSLLLKWITFLLVVWFVLYGDAHDSSRLAAGGILSGLLLLTLLFRSLPRAQPVDRARIVLLNRAERIAFGQLDLVVDKGAKPPDTVWDARMRLLLNGISLSVCRRLARLARGGRGASRIAVFVLIEYVASFVMIGVAAVSTWALILRAALAPISLSLISAVRTTAAQFLPGMRVDPLPGPIPLWVEMGPGITAWVLFVLYVAPVGSLLPARQTAFIRRVRDSYKRFRTVVVFLRKYRVLLRKWEARRLREGRISSAAPPSESDS